MRKINRIIFSFLGRVSPLEMAAMRLSVDPDTKFPFSYVLFRRKSKESCTAGRVYRFYMKMPLAFIPPPRRGRDGWG